MKRRLPVRSGAAACLAAVVVLGLAIAGDQSTAANWVGWGGPDTDFEIRGSRLAESWPEEGPPRLWSRDLGDGYSAILAEGSRLYTMYREEGQEVVVCLEAKDGTTVWERRYDATPHENHVTQFGEGPRSTPLIAGDRIYTIGISGMMHSLDKSTGEVAWSRDLWKEFGGNFLNHGYSSSPIEYKDNVIVLVGGENQSVVALRKKDGEIAWKNQSFENSYSTPRILELNGEPQLVTFMATELVGLDPDNGELKWKYDHTNQWKQNIAMPIRIEGDRLFLSSPQAGARGLKLTRRGGKTEVEEIWATRKIQFYHVTTIRQGDYVYGSTGTMGPAFLAAVNMRTGEIAWRERGFAKANLLLADGKLILLDEEGHLALATATPEKLTVHSKVKLLDDVAWTVPTLVGETLYVRDKKQIMALDIGRGGGRS